jgi:tRNA (guanine37-N1)-methyltransferase
MPELRFDVATIFPEVFRPETQPLLRQGVVGRAVAAGLVEVVAHDIRERARDRHRQVDDLPFGGGAGMVMKPEPIFETVEEIRGWNRGPVVLFEPWGEPLDQELARRLSAEPALVLVCGRYEGVDDRVRQGLEAREVSIGDYVLSGGELAALVLIDAVARLVPGVVGDAGSLAQDSFSGGRMGHPQYTRPAEYRGMKVPEVLLSGHHARIEEWRTREALRRTEARRRMEEKTR